MTVIIKNTGETRNQMIESASQVFALKDFKTATIAGICHQAGANLATVIHHFGSKESLSRKAWRQSFRRGVEVHPADRGVSDDAHAQECLKGVIRALLARITDKDDKAFLIGNREMINPTGLIKEVMKSEVVPLHPPMEAIVRDLLGK